MSPVDRASPALPVFFGLCAGLAVAGWINADAVHHARGVCRAGRITVSLDHAARVDDLAVHQGEIVFAGQPLLHWTDLEREAEIERRQRRVDELTSRLAAADAKYEAELSRQMAALDRAIRSHLVGERRASPEFMTPVALTVTEHHPDRVQTLRRERLELPSRLRAELEISALRWELVAAEASLAELRGQAVGRTLTAPAAGAVAAINVRSGEELTTGGAAITLSVPGRPRILAELPAAQVRDRTVGDRVEVVFDHCGPLPGILAELRPGRLVAGTGSAAADRDYVTARIVPCESDPWPPIRDGAKVSVVWGCGSLAD